MTLTSIVLSVFGCVVAVLLVRAFLRRGQNLLETLAPLAGESTLGEYELEYCPVARRRALVNSFAYLPVRVRATTRRIVVAQRGLGSDKHVLRYVFLLDAPGSSSAYVYRDGYYTVPLAFSASAVAEHAGERTLRLVPADESLATLEYLQLRGAEIDRLALHCVPSERLTVNV
jgi:hypothetical protein